MVRGRRKRNPGKLSINRVKVERPSRNGRAGEIDLKRKYEYSGSVGVWEVYVLLRRAAVVPP